jgi:Flp pilus assembly protein TadD
MPQMTIQQALELAEDHQLAGRLAQAEAICRQILAADASNPIAMHLMGIIALSGGRPDEALRWMQQSLAILPTAELYCSLGQVYASLLRIEEGIQSLRTSIAMRPDYPEALHDLAVALLHAGNLDEAIAAHRKAISLRPDWALGHHDLALALLMKGEYREGFSEYEWRFRAPELGTLVQPFSQPRWDGSDLNGKTILLHAEQGFGDTLQFVRYVPIVQQRGGKIILQCQPELMTLLAEMNASWTVLPRGAALPAFDVRCSLVSLPHVFGTTLETVPASVPYLHADPARVRRFRERFASVGNFEIGLAWSTGKLLQDDPYRSRAVPLFSLLPLLQMEEVTCISLQKGDATKQMWDLPAQTNLIRAADEPVDFADTAARIRDLDLVIAVDTAVAHLAGAMGKPTWVMLPFASEWRWMRGREDSPWYPTVRIFRQTTPGDWGSVVERMMRELSAMISA